MSTPIADTYELIRATLGDFHSVHKRYADAAIASVVRTVVRTGGVPGYAVDATNLAITPTISEPKDLALLMYKAALKFLLPNAASYAYDTRAIRERFGEQKLFLAALEQEIYDLENSEIFGSWNSLYAWINGMTGLNYCAQILPAPGQPAATTAVTTAAETIRLITGEVAIDPEDAGLPVVTVDISAHGLGSVTSIEARLIAPEAVSEIEYVFSCVLLSGWTATQFKVRLLGMPEVEGYKIAYTLIP